MSPQISCLWGCKVTLVASVWLFSNVRFQMFPQIACLRGGKVTLVAFVLLFLTVYFHMIPQSACIIQSKVTLVAFVWLFSTVRFQMCLQIACPKRGIVALIAFVWFSLFIICVSQGNTNIDPTFTKVIICKILIHHRQSRIVVLCVVSVGLPCTKWTPQQFWKYCG